MPQGRGSRIFTLVHLLIQVTSAILSVAFLAEALDGISGKGVANDGAAAVLSTILLLSAIVAILWISLSSKTPFESHGIVLAFLIWGFVGSFALKIYAFIGTNTTLANSHNVRQLETRHAHTHRDTRAQPLPVQARVVGLLCFLSESLGIAFVFAAMVTGLAASRRAPPPAPTPKP